MISLLLTLCKVLTGVLVAGLCLCAFMVLIAAVVTSWTAAQLDDHYRERRDG